MPPFPLLPAEEDMTGWYRMKGENKGLGLIGQEARRAAALVEVSARHVPVSS